MVHSILLETYQFPQQVRFITILPERLIFLFEFFRERNDLFGWDCMLLIDIDLIWGMISCRDAVHKPAAVLVFHGLVNRAPT